MSVSSPATGAETDEAADAPDSPRGGKGSPGPGGRGAARERGKVAARETIEVSLEHARWRHFGWMIFGLAAGALLVVIFGIVAQVLGAIFLLIAAFAGYAFVRTLLHPPGRIVVGDGALILPAGLCRGIEHRFPLAEVRQAFFLRRAVPWTRASPVLVVEVGDRAFSYPRDWFVSERHQRRIADAIHGHLGRDGE